MFDFGREYNIPKYKPRLCVTLLGTFFRRQQLRACFIKITLVRKLHSRKHTWKSHLQHISLFVQAPSLRNLGKRYRYKVFSHCRRPWPYCVKRNGGEPCRVLTRKTTHFISVSICKLRVFILNPHACIWDDYSSTLVSACMYTNVYCEIYEGMPFHWFELV